MIISQEDLPEFVAGLSPKNSLKRLLQRSLDLEERYGKESQGLEYILNYYYICAYFCSVCNDKIIVFAHAALALGHRRSPVSGQQLMTEIHWCRAPQRLVVL